MLARREARPGGEVTAFGECLGGGAKVVSAVATMAPTPGIFISRRAVSSRSARWRTSFSKASICALNPATCASSMRASVTTAAGSVDLSFSIAAASLLTCAMPVGAITPYSARCPRNALTVWVRWRTRSSRVRYAIAAACCASDFTATNRIVGRVAASAIASASAMSFCCRFTNGFTYAGGINVTGRLRPPAGCVSDLR